MIQKLIEELESHSAQLQETWHCCSSTRTDRGKLVLSRPEVHGVFLTIISGLKKVSSSPPDEDYQTLTQVLSKEIVYFRDLALGQQYLGLSLVEFLSAFKCIKSFFEKCSDQLAASDKQRRVLSNALGKVVDCIEIEVLELWQTTGSQGVKYAGMVGCQVLANKKATYKSVFDSTSNLVLITDGKGAIHEVNPEAKIRFANWKVIGCPAWDVLGVPCHSIEELLEYIPADAMREIAVSLPEGDRSFSLQVKSLSCMHPSAEGALLILSDITHLVDHRRALERRIVEKSRDLLRSQAISDTIFQSVGQGILLLDDDLEVMEANMMASEMFGIPLEVLIGTSFQSLTDDRGLELMAHSCGALETGEVRSLELQGIYVDGRQFPCMITVASMDLDGQAFWPIIVSDITEQKNLEIRLVSQRQNAEEMNVTLRNVLATIEEQRREFEQRITSRIRSMILPGIAKVESEKDAMVRASYLALLKDQLTALTTGFDNPLEANLLKLSKTELRICQFIKAGLSGKEIGSTMNLAFETIQSHRKNIRRKLGLRGRETSLYAFLAESNLDPQ